MIDYETLCLIDEARNELRAAYAKNAGLSAERAQHEEAIKKLDARLAKNAKVAAVLNDPRFAKLMVLKDHKFLQNIQDQVAADFVRSHSQIGKAVMASTNGIRTRLTEQEKKEILVEFVKANKGKQLKVSDIDAALKARGIATPASTWVKALELPENALVRVSSAVRDGTHFRPRNVPWLRDHA